MIIIFSGCNYVSKIYDHIGDSEFAKDDYEKAIFYYKKAIKFDSLNTDAIHSIGRAFGNQGDYLTAIKFYSQVTKIDSLNALALRSLGFANFKLGEFETAKDFYFKSLEIDSKNSTAYSNLGAIYEELEQFSLAKKYFYLCLELNPDHYGVMTALANIEFDFGEDDSAKSLSYRSIGHLTEGKDAPHNTLGKLYYKMGLFDSAIHHFGIAISYDPDGSLYFEKRGNSFYSKHNYQKAINDYNKAIDLEPEHPPFYFSRGKANFACSKFNDALIDFNNVISFVDKYEGYQSGAIYNRYKYYVGYYHRAIVKKQLGDFDGYIVDSLTAIGQGYSNIDTSFIVKELIDN